MKSRLSLLLALGLAASVRAADWTPDPGFVSLFNGRDLTGWCFRAKPEKGATKPGAILASFDGKTESNDDGRYSAKDGVTVERGNHLEKIERRTRRKRWEKLCWLASAQRARSTSSSAGGQDARIPR